MTASRPDELIAVAVGGVVGALLRASISVAVPHTSPDSWPWASFRTNLLGCLVLGVILDWADSRHGRWSRSHPRRARLARPLLASGLLGGFTTFSTFSLEAFGLIDSGALALAIGYAVASVVIGVVMVVIGRRLGALAFGAARIDLRQDELL